MDEFEIIRRFFTSAGLPSDVHVGVGDDGAVLEPRPGRDLVAVVDTLVAGVHYPPELPADDIGFRAVAVNLSDVAAMGADPRWMTLALTLVEGDGVWLEALSRGVLEAAAEHSVALVGGDTTQGGEVVVTVQVLGDVERGRAITRAGARPGDTVYVSGTIGDAAAGLHLLTAGEAQGNAGLVARFGRPTARVELGRALCGVASAAIDISDGFYGDLNKLTSASGVGAEIDARRLPLSASLIERFPKEEALRFALTGGDDYELLFTAPPDADVPAIADETGTPVAAIGRIREGDEVTCRDGERSVDVFDRGYVHCLGERGGNDD